MIRAIVATVLVVALAGCASPSTVEPEEAPVSQQTTAPSVSTTVEPTGTPTCITVSATWLGHIQYFMDDGYTVIRAAAAPGADGYTSIAVLYTSPAGEEILGSWATGGEPASDTMMQVFPLDDVTGSHTVVMVPNSSVLTSGLSGVADATSCLG